jgi:hypothetical protein
MAQFYQRLSQWPPDEEGAVLSSEKLLENAQSALDWIADECSFFLNQFDEDHLKDTLETYAEWKRAQK